MSRQHGLDETPADHHLVACSGPGTPGVCKIVENLEGRCRRREYPFDVGARKQPLTNYKE